MDLNDQVHHLISRYDLPPLQRLDSLGAAGGFSGARIWKLAAGNEEYCVRRWPRSHPDQDRLRWIHRVLLQAHQNGCPYIAAPVVDRAGGTFAEIDGRLWEISPWKPGQADFVYATNERRLANMAQALARFHLASAKVNLDFDRSASVGARLEQLTTVNQTISDLRRSPFKSGDRLFEDFRQTVSARAGPWASKLQAILGRYNDTVFPIQPVIRDVWHDHVLFTGDEVSGLVDFGAMQIDNVALDLARLLGSTVRDDRNQWEFAVQSYQEIRPLGDAETELLPLLDKSGIILGSLNWLKWICLERRQFENWQDVMKRIEYLGERLLRLSI